LYRRRAMQQLLLMGHNQRALALLDDLMRELGLPNPKRPGVMLAGLLRRRTAIRLRGSTLPQLSPMPQLSPTPAEPMERVRLDVTWDGAVGLALIDPLRAFYLHSLHLDRAFHAGENSRLARALMGETPYLAAAAQPSKRLDSVLGLADEAAVRVGFPALEQLGRGTAAFLFGRWAECHTRMGRAEELLAQDRPRLVREGFGPAQLQQLTRRLDLVAMIYLGELREVARRTRELLQDAIDRNDLSSATHLRTGVQTLVHLAFDAVDVAQRHADAGIAPWHDAQVGLAHFMDVQARSLIDMYCGKPAEAHRRIKAAWFGLARAGVFRARYFQTTLLDLRARAAVATARGATKRERRKLLGDARTCAARLRSTPTAWANAAADAVLGSIALCEDDLDGARVHLAQASERFIATDMVIHAAVATSVAGDDAAVANARNVFAGAGIVDVPRFTRLLLPH
jgi:hypothetical protein